jgi:C4-dicarboxylate-specific signal transduction histidine kinase
VISLWRHSAETGHPFETEVRIRRSDGVYRWFHAHGLPLRDADGHIVRWYSLLTDIEDRKNAEEALPMAQERLSKAAQLATLGELAASIAHEVNQTLSAVVANGHACLRWLSAQPPNLVKAHEAAERIVRGGKDTGEVVRRVRSLFKRANLEKVALDLNEIIWRCSASWVARRQEGGLRWQLIWKETWPPWWAIAYSCSNWF